MADPRKKNSFKPRSGLLILIGICLFLMLLSYFSAGFNRAFRSGINAVLMPMQKGMNTAGRYLFGRLENFRDLQSVREDNEILSEELAELRAENARLKLKEEELLQLHELLNMAEQYPEYETIGAHIIGKNSGNWYQSFMIDRGQKDGIKVNMNVIAGGGLVGIITAMGEHYAVVTSLINDDQYVSAMSARTGSNFIVSGDLKLYADGLVGLKNANRTADIEVGDMVVTSNISELYLPGLLIGYVSEISMDSNQLEKSGTIRPVADFEDLDSVLVITTLKELGD
ncbi:MAG: rod shape-determining protein MreC [Lachnospiraceae bacterium]|nr:rod shape-determining protein MreC [Lachnospiraceae bacterium]